MESIRALGLNPQVDEDVLDEMNQVYIEARYPSDFGLLPGGPPTGEIVERFLRSLQKCTASPNAL